jgi:hypothetical protein
MTVEAIRPALAQRTGARDLSQLERDFLLPLGQRGQHRICPE